MADGKVCKDPNCRRAGEIIPWDDFTKHPKTKDGKWTICKECLSKRRSEGQKRRQQKDKARKQLGQPHNPPQKSTSNGKDKGTESIVLAFDGRYKEIGEKLKRCAKEEFRGIEQQVMYILKDWLQMWEEHGG